MNEELKHPQETGGTEFERQDLNAKGIFWFLVGLAIFLVVVGVVLNGMYGFLSHYNAEHQPAQNPLVAPQAGETRDVSPLDAKKFPEPRLETAETNELRSVREQEENILNSYGWVDQKAGVARIPIDRAMQLIVQQGLPTRPQNGTTPLVTKPAGVADVVKERGRLKAK